MKNFAQNFCIMRVEEKNENYCRRKKKKFFLVSKIYFFHSNFNILNFKSTHAYFLCSRLCHTASLSHCLSCTVSTLEAMFFLSFPHFKPSMPHPSWRHWLHWKQCFILFQDWALPLTLSRLRVASRCVPRSRWTRGWTCPVTSRCTRDVGSSNITKILSIAGILPSCKER